MSSNKIRPTRFAHLEGHTDICYSEDGKYLITCGLDGDIRIFKGLDDDDCITHTIADQVHCVAFRDGSIIAGTNLNIVQSYTVDEGKPNGLITRTTAYPTHINVSRDNKLIAVASSDMLIKVHDTENFKETIFSCHAAPVLSVAIDPQRKYLATSSCDGKVIIWDLKTQSNIWDHEILPKCNDFSFSSTLCRLCWSHDGQYLFVPVKSELQVISRNALRVDFVLTHPSITETGSVATLSPCGNYVALGCRDGRIIVWDWKKRTCIISEKSSRGMAITGLVWHPRGKEELAFVNGGGEIGTMENFLQESLSSKSEETKDTTSGAVGTGVEEDIFPPLSADDADEENEISISKIKLQLGFADDEEGTFLGLPKTRDDESKPPSRADTPVPSALPPTVVAPKLPEPQKPFQPGMSPEHHNDRYMVWNNIGIVRQYQSDDEQSIEVEFHDSSVHHALHLNNHMGCSMAALNHQALVLAAESQEDTSSKLVVHHFNAWDGSKEWQTEMPEEEEVLAVGLGNGWVAAATDLRNLRIFSTAGNQIEVITIPGPVVCLAGFEKNVMVIFHSGMGVCGEQSMSAVILSTCGRKAPFSTSLPLSLSPKSYLMWAGFTDEGTPMTMDSAGMVRLLVRTAWNWVPVLKTKAHAKGKSDHFFILGGSEVQGMVRCILCKGSRHPPVLPRPHVSLLSFKIPLCEPESEKSNLEEMTVRTKLLSSTLDRLAEGFDVEAQQFDVNRNLKESMVKLFALACRADRESRGVEVCEGMPAPEMVEVAMKYAAKLSRMQLAERLNKAVQQKREIEPEEELPLRDSIRYRTYSLPQDVYEREASPALSSDTVDAANVLITENLLKSNPILAASHKANESKSALDRIPFTPTTRNPFKRATPSSGSSSKGGFQVIDRIKVTTETEASPVLRPVMKKIKPKPSSSTVQTVATKTSSPAAHMMDKENVEVAPSNATCTPPPAAKKPSALKLWLEDNKDFVKEKFPAATEMELLVKAAAVFKDVDESTKQKYKSLAAGFSTEQEEKTNDNDKKRKNDDGPLEEPSEKKCKSVGSKLAGFAFTKKSDS